MVRRVWRGVSQPPRGLVQGKPAETVTEKGERQVETALHFADHVIDKIVEVADRAFVDPAQPPGRFYRDQLDVGADQRRPVLINRGATTGERETEQPCFGRGVCTDRYEPTVGRLDRGRGRWRNVRGAAKIGEGAFVGTNSSLVAPVKIGKGAYIGSGSVITKDVPDDALAVERSQQTIREGGAKRYREIKTRDKKPKDG